MSIGAGIALFVIGAVLAFAINVDFQYVDLHLIGYILMIAGAVVFVLGLVIMLRGRRSETITSTSDGSNDTRVTRRETSTDDGV